MISSFERSSLCKKVTLSCSSSIAVLWDVSSCIRWFNLSFKESILLFKPENFAFYITLQRRDLRLSFGYTLERVRFVNKVACKCGVSISVGSNGVFWVAFDVLNDCFAFWVVITWSWLVEMKFQPVQPRQISPYDYMWKLNFVMARRDSFPPGIWLDLHAFSLDFSLQARHFTKLEIHRFPLI